ncbi:MAG: hypothetical protein NTV98_02680 [Candidatus Roizmanbacteria bacterium]|nr:hypothetical protein [Candidatus Roizmanbacteria bacterium]
MASNIASLFMFFKRSIGLIFTPYSSMRKISLESTWHEYIWILILTIAYFVVTNTVHFWMNGLIGAFGLYGSTIIFFSLLPSHGTIKEKMHRLTKTWTYTLLPTLIWFYSTLFFYFLIPPPRTASILGQSFSIFYIAFSMSLLVWKLILTYLSIRFSLRIHLYRVIYYILIYLALSIPLWIFLYNIGISRVPFV